MPRLPLPVGSERVVNGYLVIKQSDGTWRYKHHLVAEEKLERPLKDTERVSFKDRDKRNFSYENLEIKWKSPPKDIQRKAHLYRRLMEARHKVSQLEEQIRNVGGDPDDMNVPIAIEQDGRGGREY